MATKDYRRAEKKKPKKGMIKPLAPSLIAPPVEVEVARKKGKKEGEFPGEEG